jgi:hypothetical protein
MPTRRTCWRGSTASSRWKQRIAGYEWSEGAFHDAFPSGQELWDELDPYVDQPVAPPAPSTASWRRSGAATRRRVSNPKGGSATPTITPSS